MRRNRLRRTRWASITTECIRANVHERMYQTFRNRMPIGDSVASCLGGIGWVRRSDCGRRDRSVTSFHTHGPRLWNAESEINKRTTESEPCDWSQLQTFAVVVFARKYLYFFFIYLIHDRIKYISLNETRNENNAVSKLVCSRAHSIAPRRSASRQMERLSNRATQARHSNDRMPYTRARV